MEEEDNRRSTSRQQGKLSKREQLMNKQQQTITAGFNEYMVTEKDGGDFNHRHQHLERDFSDQEITEVFKILDLNGQGYITREDLHFFMEMLLSDNLVQSVSPNEIDEMIRLCDKNGEQKVRLEEFIKMAHNKSLNPIGQAFQPTRTQLEAKKVIENMKEDTQYYNQHQTMHSNFNKQFGQTQVSNYKVQTVQNNNFYGTGKTLDQSICINQEDKKVVTKFINVRNKNDVMHRFIQGNALEADKFDRVYSKIRQLDLKNLYSRCNYHMFMQIFEIEDSELHRKSFNCLVHANDTQIIDIREFLIALVSKQPLAKEEQMFRCFQLFDLRDNGIINVKDFLKIVQIFNLEVSQDKTTASVQRILKSQQVKSDMLTMDKILVMLELHPDLY